MQAIVTGPFMHERKILRPSLDPDDPLVVDLSVAVFKRQSELGNVTSAEAYFLRRESEKDIERRRIELEREADALEKRAMLDIEDRLLLEEVECLGDMSKDALVDLAMRRKLHVNTRRSEENLRAEIRAKLEPLVDAVLEKDSAGPEDAEA